MAEMSKVLVVVGATGKQGSSVIRTFLEDSSWRVRGISRNPASPAAQELQSAGAEIVQADLNDRESLDSAFDGATAIFANTDFWTTFNAQPAKDIEASKTAYDVEVTQGMNIAYAATKVATLERFVYSALSPAKRASGGKYSHLYHWDSKAAVVDFINNECEKLAAKTSLLYMGVYSDNSFAQPVPIDAAGKLAIVNPVDENLRVPFVDPKGSTGPFVRALIEEEPIGTKLLAYDSRLNKAEIAGAWSSHLGKIVEPRTISVEQMSAASGIPLEMLEAPAFINDFGYLGGLDGVVEPGQLKKHVGVASFEEWLKNQPAKLAP